MEMTMPEVTRDPAVAVARLRAATRVLVTSHMSPDGDALGSALAFAELARALGIEATVASHDPTPASLAFLPGAAQVAVAPELPRAWEQRFDLVAVLECPGLDRPGFSGLDRVPILNVDHHLANTGYGAVNFIDENAPAVGEMVLAMAEAAGVLVSPSMATNLYVALVTDTGDFRYSNTTPRAFVAAARLVAAGAQPCAIAESLCEHNPVRVVRLTAAVLATLELLADGRVAVITCDSAMLAASGAGPEDTENLINIPRAIDGVHVAVLFKAFRPGSVRVSMRSRDDIDVQAVASLFGGGGHRNAAGCTVAADMSEARREVLASVLAALGAA
jgi:bifunctional oligoribonuclease and PAP phosphatase NrnA